MPSIHHTFTECVLSAGHGGREMERKFVHIPVPQAFNLIILLFKGKNKNKNMKSANKVV